MKKALLAVAKVRTKVVPVEGVDVLVREVGAAEFGEYGQLLSGDKKSQVAGDKVKATALLLSYCIVEDTDTGLVPVYTEVDAIDLARSARVSMPIVNAIMELSGFGKDEKEDVSGEPDAN